VSCGRIRDWLHRDADGLEEAQRLLLDDHLAACESCRADRERMRLLHRIGASLEVPPAGAREYQRAIARALLEGTARPAAPARVLPRGWPIPLVVAAAAAAVVVAVVARRGDHVPPAPMAGPPPADSPRPEQPPIATAPSSTDVVEDGALVSGDRTIEAGDAVPDGPLRAIQSSRLRLAAAHVVVAASAELRWVAADRTVLLERGAIELDITAGGATRVITNRFEVEVEDGTIRVEPAAVRVDRGRARVVDKSRATLAVLDAGAAWTPDPAAGTARGPTPRARLADLLAEARARFAARDHAAAERLASEVLAASPARGMAAEAQVILADAAHARDDLERAVRRYRKVAETFSDLPAAESSLYAAARIELRRKRSVEARGLLERYLERYPTGRYADDVRRQLAPSP
jgi:hypothetical protein